jgi:hypothetical protein
MLSVAARRLAIADHPEAIAETKPANVAYICRGVLTPDLVNAIAMFGVMPDAQIPETW